MCLIVRGRIGDLLELDLQRAQTCNSDGWGIHTHRNVAYSFTSKEEDIVKFLQNKKKEVVATIHFRYATHGDVNVMNAHPFHIGEQTFLMHNGVLYGDHFQHKTKSDTMRLAEILADAGPLSRSYILDSLTETEWYSNRFCLLSGKSWQVFGDWDYDKTTHTWHSNRSLLSGYTHIPSAKSSACTAGSTLLWDADSRSWVPKYPPAASVTHGHMYDPDDELVDLDGLSEAEIEKLIADYNAEGEMEYEDVPTDTEVVDVTDPFYVGQDA